MKLTQMPTLFWGLDSAQWAALGALASALTALVAIAAAAIALFQLNQARKLSEEQARPYVVAFIEESEVDWKLADFVVKNVGLTAARNLSIALDPPYVRAKEIAGYEFMGAKFFSSEVSVLPPGRELRTFLDSGEEIAHSGEDVALPFAATLTYFDRRGQRIVDVYPLDPSAQYGTSRADVHGLHHIANSLRGIAKHLGVSKF